jgi:hypothetical protein
MRPTQKDAGRLHDLRDDETPDFLEMRKVALLAILEDGDELSLRVRHRLALVCARLGVDCGVVPPGSSVAAAFGVKSAPMLLVFDAGEVVDRLIGAPPEEIVAETVRARLAS